MPLLAGKKNIGHNIKVEEEHGKPHKQAVAIALNKAREGDAKDPNLLNYDPEYKTWSDEKLKTESVAAGKAKKFDTLARYSKERQRRDKKNAKATDAEIITGFEKDGGTEKRNCSVCQFMVKNGGCSQPTMDKASAQPRNADGLPTVGKHDVCKFFKAEVKPVGDGFITPNVQMTRCVHCGKPVPKDAAITVGNGFCHVGCVKPSDYAYEGMVGPHNLRVRQRVTGKALDEIEKDFLSWAKMTALELLRKHDSWPVAVSHAQQEIKPQLSSGEWEEFMMALRRAQSGPKQPSRRVRVGVADTELPTAVKTSSLVPMPSGEHNEVSYGIRRAKDGVTAPAGTIIRKVDGEYQVKLREWGWEHPGVYFTDDPTDAVDTAKAMRAHVDKGKATDALVHVAQRYEIRGNRKRAMDAYRAAAKQGSKQALDGIQACKSVYADIYTHPGRGRVKVCDSAEAAMRTALERTRAGERVRIADGKVVRPGRANDAEVVVSKCSEHNVPGKTVYCDECLKEYKDGQRIIYPKSNAKPVIWSKADLLKGATNKLANWSGQGTKDATTFHRAEPPKPKSKLLSVADPAERKQMIAEHAAKGKDDWRDGLKSIPTAKLEGMLADPKDDIHRYAMEVKAVKEELAKRKSQGKDFTSKGHNCDACGASLPEEAYGRYGGWDYKCPKCKFKYSHGSSKTVEEQMTAQGKDETTYHYAEKPKAKPKLLSVADPEERKQMVAAHAKQGKDGYAEVYAAARKRAQQQGQAPIGKSIGSYDPEEAAEVERKQAKDDQPKDAYERGMLAKLLQQYGAKYDKDLLLKSIRTGRDPWSLQASQAFDEHVGFNKLKNELSHEKGVTDPAALAASIGRKKYGAAGMAKKSAAGRAKDREVLPV